MSLELSRFLFSGSRISDQSDGTGFIMRGSRYTPCVATSGAYKVHIESGTVWNYVLRGWAWQYSAYPEKFLQYYAACKVLS